MYICATETPVYPMTIGLYTIDFQVAPVDDLPRIGESMGSSIKPQGWVSWSGGNPKWMLYKGKSWKIP